MLADRAAREIRKALKKLPDVPDGCVFRVTTSQKTTVYVSIEGVCGDWVWEYVEDHLQMTVQAQALEAAVWDIVRSFRTELAVIEGIHIYSYNAQVFYDYKILKPELIPTS